MYNDLKLKIVENQDLYRNKDDIPFFLTKSSYILYLVSNSVKCIICRMNYNIIYVCRYSVYKVDYRGAAAPKKMVHSVDCGHLQVRINIKHSIL